MTEAILYFHSIMPSHINNIIPSGQQLSDTGKKDCLHFTGEKTHIV